MIEKRKPCPRAYFGAEPKEAISLGAFRPGAEICFGTVLRGKAASHVLPVPFGKPKFFDEPVGVGRIPYFSEPLKKA